MNPVAVAKDPEGRSTTKRFGFGYEKQCANSPSTELARAEFLSPILETKPEVVSSLFNTAYHHFSCLLARNEDLIASLCHSLESEIPEEAYILRQKKYIRERAIERLIPNWLSLQQRDGADSLRVAIEDWALNHNLRADWCLDHAIDFLREFEGSEYKEWASSVPNVVLLRDLVRRAWQSALVNRHCHALGVQYQSNVEVEERGAFSFVFESDRIRFEVPGPFNKFIPAFKEEVEKTFVALAGPSIPGARKSLRHRLAMYLEEVERVRQELGLKKPPVRWAAGEHFNWLINYQIPPCMNYRQIAGVDKDEKTVREGIEDVARLVGLTLRRSKAGRPKGSKDTGPRHIARRH
jgi:hypothetical protein